MVKMKNKIGAIVMTGFIVMLISSCDLTKKYENREKEEIMNYLSQHPELTFELKPSGLYYLDVTVGTGPKPIISDTVFVFFSGYYLDGSKFTSNVGEDAYAFPAGEGYVIPGFDEGVMFMREGGTAKILIPSYLGYGNSGYYMPAYTPLLFEVELDSIVAGPGKK
ncbi:MAG TPA: hypothetical protein DDW27_01710 [Bacteroidales bacterium]|nr:hypothetical protein [Bacteroidales bacterium]